MKKAFLSIIFVLCSLFCSAELKYVFYFIGDGMGHNQVLGAEMYRSAIEGQPLGRVRTLMTTFPYSGSASTHSKSNGITDSAAAGTCLATDIRPITASSAKMRKARMCPPSQKNSKHKDGVSVS